ncbi:MAG: NAD(P)-dependent oxidoreductase [Alphaproteobacteria bacterium]|nr:NAD(P)-dependent oxidoreductase [Alphaproteobacteria bacterium]
MAGKAAFIGLGVMGFPMAGHLVAKGFEVTVFNRTAPKAAAWTSTYKGRSAPTPREAAAGAETVCLCVGNDDDLRSVAYGDHGVIAGMKPGAVLVDHTTASATVARELHDAAKAKSIGFLDAPVSGGQAGAEKGTLTIMVGGEAGPFERARPAMEAYGRPVFLGPPGSGQLAKMMNQICIAGIVQGLAEALNFGVRAGLDVDKVVGVISKGAAQSWQMENRAQTMLEGRYDFGFAVNWMRKDLGICLEEADRNGARLPLTALVDQFYKAVQAKGGQRQDTSSLMRLLAED